MQQAWHILTKDLRRLRIHVAVWLAMVAFVLLAYPVELMPNAEPRMQLMGFLQFLIPVGLGLIVAELVLQEPLSGTTSFWLGRPYDWRGLLGAKFLFVLLCLHLPLLLMQAACLLRNGFPVMPHLPALLAKHGALLAGVVAFAAAIASLSRNLGHFALVALAVLAAGTFVSEAFVMRAWFTLGWIGSAAHGLVVALTAAAVVLLQYRWRRTRASATVAFVGAAAALALAALLPWNAAMAIQSRASGGAPVPLRVEIAGPRDDSQKRYSPRGFVSIRVPVTIQGPGSLDLASLAARVDLPGFASTWRDAGLNRKNAEIYEHSFQVQRAFYQAHRDEPITVRAEAFVTTYRSVGDHVVPIQEAPTEIEGMGRCAGYTNSFGGEPWVEIYCLTGAGYNKRTLIEIDGDWRTFQIGGHGSGLLVAPLTVSPWGWRGTKTKSSSVTLRQQQEQASFPIHWSYENFRLADYAIESR